MRENFCAQNRTRTCTALRPLVPETSVSTNFTIWAIVLAQKKIEKKSETSSFALTLSEKRDSNPRPRPWQGRALPTELFSQLFVGYNTEIVISISLAKAGQYPFFWGKVVLYQLSCFRKNFNQNNSQKSLFLFCFAVQRYCVFDNLQTFSSKKIRNFYLSFLICMHYSNNQLFIFFI